VEVRVPPPSTRIQGWIGHTKRVATFLQLQINDLAKHSAFCPPLCALGFLARHATHSLRHG